VNRIFFQTLQNNNALSKDQQFYLKKVLRMKNGQKIIVFDQTKEYLATLSDDHLILDDILRVKNLGARKFKVALSLIRKSRLDWALEKLVEVGVDEIFPIITKRSQFKDLNLERAKKILIEAAEQSNRIGVPVIHSVRNFDDFLKEIDYSEWSFASLTSQEDSVLNSSISGVVIGPEGGFCESEESVLLQKIKAISLGESILRSETASIIALAKIKGIFSA
jgi:16S rRNA (uracil1498-N3)-methyltransferase